MKLHEAKIWSVILINFFGAGKSSLFGFRCVTHLYVLNFDEQQRSEIKGVEKFKKLLLNQNVEIKMPSGVAHYEDEVL